MLWLRSISRCILALFATAVACRSAQTNSSWMVRVWSREGLTNRNVTTVLQAPDGFVWVATSSNLARFDGKTFEPFSLSDLGPFRDQRVDRMIRTRDGHIWLATSEHELVRVGRDAPLIIANVASEGGVQSIIEASDGSIWASYSTGQVCHVKDGGIEWKGMPQGFGSAHDEYARCMLAVDASGAVWCNQGGHLGILNGTTATMFNRHTLPSAHITGSSKAGIWLAATNGIYRVTNKAKFQRVDGNVGPRFGATPTVMFEDHLGALWIGTLNDGLFRFSEDAGLEQIATSYQTIQALTDDSEGNIWVGTAGGGLDRVSPRAIGFEGGATGLPQKTIQSLCEDSNGTLWASTQNGMLVRRATDGSWESAPGWPSSVTSMAADAKGGIWFGSTDRSLYHLHDGAVDAWHENDGIEAHTVNLVAVGKDGTVWAAGERPPTLVRFRNGQLEPVALPDKAPRIECLGVGPDGTVWAGGQRGTLLRIEGDRVVEVTPRGSPRSTVRAMEFQPDGTLWIGYSGGGIARLQNENYRRITTHDGLYSNSVSHLLSDTRGWLWCGGQDGVFKVRLQMLTDFMDRRIARVQSVHFGPEDELPNLQVTNKTWGAAVRTRDGRIWLPMGPALVIADPSRSRETQAPPAVFVTRVSVDGRLLAAYGGGIDRQRAKGAAIALPASAALSVAPVRQRLEFEFTGLNFTTPENVRYRYRLDPFDDDWVSTGERLASYVRVPPGHYAFRVQASNGDGVWTNTSAPLTVTISPFFWQTPWFRAGVGAAVLCLGYGVYRWRVRRIRRRAQQLQAQNTELERRIFERTAELAKSLEALKASEYFYHSLVESLPQAIVRKDIEGRITYANSGYADVIGQPIASIIGRFEHELHAPDVAMKIQQDDRDVIATRQAAQSETVLEKPGQPKRYLHVKKVPLYDSNGQPIGVQVLFWDWTVFRETEENLKRTQRELIEASRYAGMAEVATGVLHNIGNALNSVNVSATFAAQRIANIRPDSLARVAELLVGQGDRLADFIVNDPRGRKLPDFLQQLSQHLAEESGAAAKEIQTLRTGIEHINDIVASQQDFARASDVPENVPPAELIEYAIEINGAAMARHEITVLRDYAEVPLVRVQRQKTLQILVNLLNNAKDAMDEVPPAQRRLTVTLRATEKGQVEISITDNGRGIAPENLTRIFNFGFTTKKTGHGFGLHSSANSAREMHGMLTARSDGIGHGATFTLSVPIAAEGVLAPAA